MFQRVDSWLSRKSFDYLNWRKYQALSSSIDPSKPELVVFQMGKVGSSTVTATLKSALPDYNIFQIHLLTQEWIDRVTMQYRQASSDRGEPFIEEHVLLSRYLNGILRSPERHPQQWQLISLVREPVARNLSSFFQAFPIYFSSVSDSGGAETVNRFTPQELGNMFLNQFGDYRHKVPTVWFQTHIEPTFGIDVYAQPFDHQKGYTIIENRKARMLLLRAEDVDRVFIEAFEAFQGTRLPKIIRTNDAADKVYSGTYQETRKLIELPPSYVDDLYGSRYMQHFYTPEEIAVFRNRWLGQNA